MINAAMKIFRDIAADGPTADELSSAKEIFLKNQEEELKRNDYWLGEINGKESAALPLDIDINVKKNIAGVTPEQIKKAAAKYLLGTTRIELIAMPETAAASAPEKTGDTAK
jgi:zinc protease